MVSRASEEEGEAPASGKRNRGRSCRNDRGVGRAEAEDSTAYRFGARLESATGSRWCQCEVEVEGIPRCRDWTDQKGGEARVRVRCRRERKMILM